jgi:hypothetical protein
MKGGFAVSFRALLCWSRRDNFPLGLQIGFFFILAFRVVGFL